MLDVHNLQLSQSDKELHWYIESIILPELPQLIETLEICHNLLLYNTPQYVPSANLQKGPPITLPLSSNKLEILKGILIRDGPYIVKLSITLNQPNFNKVFHKLNLSTPMILDQIITTKCAINESIEIIKKFISLNNQSNLPNPNEKPSISSATCNHTHLMDLFHKLLTNLGIAKQNLQLPLDPKLVFPNNVARLDHFVPNLPKNISVDLYLNQAEICIDLKKLHIITEEPWCQIDESGKSYVDNIREEMKLPAISSPSTVSTPTPSTPTHRRSPSANTTSNATTSSSSGPLKLSDLDSKLNSLPHHHNFFNNMLSSLALKPAFDPMDYITKCITYNNMVVMINTKIDVTSPDPVLTSVFTKLDSLEYLIGLFLSNLDHILP